VLGHETHTCFGPLADACDGIGRRIHCTRLRTAQVEPHRAHKFCEERLLGGEVPVEETLGDTGSGADVADSSRSVTLLSEQSLGGLQQLLLAFVALFGMTAIVDHTLSSAGD